MAATKLQANWANVAHAGTTITKVTGVNFNTGGSCADFAGDTDRYPTTIVNLMSKPGAQLTTGDIAVIMGIAPGTTGSFTATHKDAAKATGGDILYTLANAVAETTSANGPFGSYGSGSISFKSFSSDGSTNPLSFTRA